VGVLDQGGQVLGLRGVDDVEEELAVRQVGVGLLLGEELGKAGLRHHVLDERHHTELIVAGHIDRAYL